METMMIASTPTTQQQIYVDDPPIAPFQLTISSNPFTWQNTTGRLCLVVINGGVVNAISYSRNNVQFDVLGILAGCNVVGLLDRLRIAYTVTPPTAWVYPL